MGSLSDCERTDDEGIEDVSLEKKEKYTNHAIDVSFGKEWQPESSWSTSSLYIPAKNKFGTRFHLSPP